MPFDLIASLFKKWGLGSDELHVSYVRLWFWRCKNVEIECKNSRFWQVVAIFWKKNKENAQKFGRGGIFSLNEFHKFARYRPNIQKLNRNMADVGQICNYLIQKYGQYRANLVYKIYTCCLRVSKYLPNFGQKFTI